MEDEIGKNDIQVDVHAKQLVSNAAAAAAAENDDNVDMELLDIHLQICCVRKKVDLCANCRSHITFQTLIRRWTMSFLRVYIGYDVAFHIGE